MMNERENGEKGIVAIGINFDRQQDKPKYDVKVSTSASMTTEELRNDMGLLIGPTMEETIVVDDKGRGFRVVKNGKKIENVEEIEPEILKKIIDDRTKSGRLMEKPVPREFINAIKEYTGYEPSIDSSMIKENKEDLDR